MILRGFRPRFGARRRPRYRTLWFVAAAGVSRRIRTGRGAVAFALSLTGERALERHTFHKGRRDLTIWRSGEGK